jgi:hypothetical protein
VQEARMAIFRSVVDVSGTSSYPGTPQVTIPFIPRTIMVMNMDVQSSVDSADVSLDGTNTIATLTPGTPSAGIVLEQKALNVWLRRTAAGTAPTNVQVIAED